MCFLLMNMESFNIRYYFFFLIEVELIDIGIDKF